MQIFLSHSSKQKPLVREIRKHFPEHLDSWIDEHRLLFGDNIENSISSVIAAESDYLLLFVDTFAVRSEWVQKEVAWALQKELEEKRTIVLPIVVDREAISDMPASSLRDRRYLELRNFSEAAVRELAEQTTAELFALVCRDMQRNAAKPRSAADKLQDADSVLQAEAKLIRKAVFPHRRGNPISKETLLTVLRSQGEEAAPGDFEQLLEVIVQRNLIPGLSYDGTELFLIEEHASWKSEVQKEHKERIARKAASLVRNGSKIFFDAGSTTEEVVNILCKRIETRTLMRLTVATTSVNIADMFSDCCVKMGFDDEFSAISLYVPGGRIRPSTQAIVAHQEGSFEHLELLQSQTGQFDIAFVGVNGIGLDGTLMTSSTSEAENKKFILSLASQAFVLGDSMKLGIKLDCNFGTVGKDVSLIVDNSENNEILSTFVGAFRHSVVLA